ncbi:MAG TPA: FAD binding domain-containing protein [Burkholderiaceae bacterium]|nr:FAD binding domain-containing protein [Burkholderiaceae bacterium]
MTPFELLDATSAADAAALLRAHAPHARPIAAGGDLLGLLKEHVGGPTLPLPAVLVNLATASDLAQIGCDDDAWHVGAMVTLARLARERALPPMIAEAIAHIASPQLRARTTLGGNLLQRPRCLYLRHPDIACFKKGGSTCAAIGGPEHAHPGALYPGRCHAGHPSDLAPVLMALDARAHVTGSGGSRTLSLAELYEGAADNPHAEARLRSDEVLAALIVPRRPRAQAFEKVAPRAANEFAWCGAAVALACEGSAIMAARIAASGIAPGPFVFEQANALLQGRCVDAVDAARVAHRLIAVEATSTVVAARIDAARLAIERALSRALQRAAAIPPHNPRSHNHRTS